MRLRQLEKKLKIFVVIGIGTLILTSNFIFLEKLQSKDNKTLTKEEKNIENSKIPNEEKIKQNLAKMKGYFTKNQGQLDNDDVYFTYSTSDMSFRFCKSSVLIKLSKTLDDNTTKSTTIKITFENSNKVIPIGKEELNHKSNYFIGNDSSKWKSNIPNYEKIIFKNLYNGIDLVYYFNEKGIKYDWIVKPYANPNDIVECFEDIDSLKIDSNGELIIHTGLGELREGKPYSYQGINGNIFKVDVSYRISKNKKVSFMIGNYDFKNMLIIDPLIYSTYIGYKEENEGYGIAVDSEKNAYITGYTTSSDFPTSHNCFDDTYNGIYRLGDVFLFKLNNEGSNLLYSTYIGGTGRDYGYSIALDSENNAYITGHTTSSDFPTTLDCYDDSYNGDGDVFVTKMNPNGTLLKYSTYVGGTEDDDYGWDIALDSENNTYITGYTKSSNFPMTLGCLDESFNGGWDVFVFKLNPNGSSLIYSTYVGGNYTDDGKSITLDSENNAYITGSTSSSNFPTTPSCYDNSFNGGDTDIFVFKLNSNGTSLLYSTYFGGSDKEYGYGIVVDSLNNSYISGYTFSEDIPTTFGVYDETFNGKIDVLIFKLNEEGSDLLFSSYIGGTKSEHCKNIEIDLKNNLYVTGYTWSSDFPTTSGSFDDSKNGDDNCNLFVFKMNFNGSKLLYSSYVGGDRVDYGYDITLDSENHVYITGYTFSTNFPTSPGCFNNTKDANSDVYVFALEIEKKPISLIKSISPNPALENKNIHFQGHGATEYGTIEKFVMQSSIDGEFYNSTKSDFYYNGLSLGEHIINLKVQNDTGKWSDVSSTKLFVTDSYINDISPTPALLKDNVHFKAIEINNKTIERYVWCSSIEGEIYNGSELDFYHRFYSLGNHIINLKFQDNNGYWSFEDSTQLLIMLTPTISEIEEKYLGDNKFLLSWETEVDTKFTLFVNEFEVTNNTSFAKKHKVIWEFNDGDKYHISIETIEGLIFNTSVNSISLKKNNICDQSSEKIPKDDVIIVTIAMMDRYGKMAGAIGAKLNFEIKVTSNKPIDILFFDNNDYKNFKKVYNNGNGKIQYYSDASFLKTMKETFIFKTPKKDIYHLVIDNSNAPDGGTDEKDEVIVSIDIWEIKLPKNVNAVSSTKKTNYVDIERESTTFDILDNIFNVFFVIMLIIGGISYFVKKRKEETELYGKYKTPYKGQDVENIDEDSQKSINEENKLIPKINECSYCHAQVPYDLKICNICGKKIKN